MRKNGKNICKNARTGQLLRLNGSGSMIEKTKCANCNKEIDTKQMRLRVGKLYFCSFDCYAHFFYYGEEEGD